MRASATLWFCLFPSYPDLFAAAGKAGILVSDHVENGTLFEPPDMPGEDVDAFRGALIFRDESRRFP